MTNETTKEEERARAWVRLNQSANHDPKIRLPPYARLTIGVVGQGVGDSPRFFSKEEGLSKLDDAVRGLKIDADEAMVVNAAIAALALPTSRQRADGYFTQGCLIFQGHEDESYARLTGLLPGEPGSGKARYERRQMSEEYAWVAASGRCFLNGIEKSVTSGHYSQEAAQEEIDRAMKMGLIDEAERATITEQMKSLGLPEKKGQVDRLFIAGDKKYAHFILGVEQAEPGACHALIEMCDRGEDDGSPHAHVRVRGRAKRDAAALYSATSATARIDALYERGYFSDAEVAQVKQKLATLDLPSTDPRDSDMTPHLSPGVVLIVH